MAFGQIVEVALAALEETLAPDSARADRDLRLADVIAGAERIALRVEEHVDPLALVAVEQIIGDRRGDRDRGRGTGEDPPRQAGEEHHRHAAEHDHDARAEVGLDEDQEGGNAEQQQRRPDGPPFADLAGRDQLVEAGEGEDDCRLHELGRLQADRPKLEPALRALADEPQRLDPDQHQEGRAVEREGDCLDRRFADPRHGDGDAEEHDENDRLLDRPWLGRAAGGRIKHEQTEARDRRDQENQAPRQPRERPRDDGRGDHAWIVSSGGKPFAESHAAVLRVARSSKVPPMLCSKTLSAVSAFCLSYRNSKVSRISGAAAAGPKPPCSTIAAAAYRGLLNGTKPMNSEWSRSFHSAAV